jgi:hypothetical protein
VAVVPAPGAPGGATVYASWNGASEVASWQVLVGSSASTLKPAGSAPKTSFETAIPVPGAAGGRARIYLAVQALDAAGAVIGASATVKG